MVNTGSPSAISTAIMKLNDKKLRESLGELARKEVLERFSINQTIKQYESIYNEILSS